MSAPYRDSEPREPRVEPTATPVSWWAKQRESSRLFMGALASASGAWASWNGYALTPNARAVLAANFYALGAVLSVTATGLLVATAIVRWDLKR